MADQMQQIYVPDTREYVQFPADASDDTIHQALTNYAQTDDYQNRAQAFRQQATDPWWKNAANFAGTGILKGVGAIGGMPHAIAGAVDQLTAPGPGASQTAEAAAAPFAPAETATAVQPSPNDKPPEPGLITRNTMSADEINQALFKGLSNVSTATGGRPIVPYQPESAPARVGMAALTNVLPSVLTGGGALSSGLRAALAGAGAGTGSQTAAELGAPGWAQFAAGIPGAIAGDLAIPAAGAVVNPLRIALGGGQGLNEAAVANTLAAKTGLSGQDIASTIGQNLPQWTPGAAPTFADVLPGNRGAANLVYTDRAGPAAPLYQAQRDLTNEAQRTAVAGATPDTSAAQLQQLTADRDAALAAIPPGTDAQTAGNLFRQNLQGVYDQRMAARRAGGGLFEALEGNPANPLGAGSPGVQVNLKPSSDFATAQAASNAGEVGQAFQRAAAQFQTPTGISLDTPAFANSVLKGLGDLQASYPAGTAGAWAVGQVKQHLEDQLASQVPEVAQARSTWAANSRPLDVFQAAPFKNALAQDRFGNRYLMPNDAVASAFLTGKGSADAMDALTKIFPDREQATAALQDYIAGQVRAKAVRPDGSIDPAALDRVITPYKSAMIRFPTLSMRFGNVKYAQEALDQQSSYQALYDKATNELGSGPAIPGQQVQAYSPAKFSQFVKDNADLIDKAYTPEQALVIKRVNQELQTMAQTDAARPPATSGTATIAHALAQHAGTGPGHNILSVILGGIAGRTVQHFLPEIPLAEEIGAGLGGSLSVLRNKSDAMFRAIQTQALLDPSFARQLMVRYNPGVPTPAAQRALGYVMQRIPTVTAPQMVQQ